MPEQCNGYLIPNGLTLVWLDVFSVGASLEPSNAFATQFRSTIDDEIFDADFLQRDLLHRYKLPGFRIRVAIEEEEAREVSAYVHVRAAIYFRSIAAITYRFQIRTRPFSRALDSDQLIVLAGMPAGVEHWHMSQATGREEMDLSVASCVVNCLHVDEEGAPTRMPETVSGANEVIHEVFGRYRRYVQTMGRPVDYPHSNSVYILMDLWENIHHSAGVQFSLLSPEGVVEHIVSRHRRELIGLLTLYPYEWWYRDATSYDRICGSNIAIDTDDLVLVNENVAIVLGTYGRRGEGSPTNWAAVVAATRAKHHVSWPEYLHVWELVVVKLHAVRAALARLRDAVPDVERGISLKKTLRSTSALSLRIGKMMVDLNAVGFARFASSKAMYKITEQRLGLQDEFGELATRLNQFDTSIKNLDTLEELHRSRIVSGLLAFITIASICQILFQDLRLPLAEWIVNPAAMADASIATRAAIAVLVGVTVAVLLMAAVAVLRLGVFFYTKFRGRLRPAG